MERWVRIGLQNDVNAMLRDMYATQKHRKFFLVTHQGLRGAKDALWSDIHTKAAIHGDALNCSVMVTWILKARVQGHIHYQ